MNKKNTDVSKEETQSVVITEDEVSEQDLALAEDFIGEEQQEQEEQNLDDEIILSDDEEESIEESNEQQKQEQEQEQEKDKTDNWTLDDYKKWQKNMEKVIGRQGQELGELRKKAAEHKEPQTPEEKIQAMTDSDLDVAINALKADILKPNAAIEDDDYSQKVIIYNDLKEERMCRKTLMIQQKNIAQESNKTVIDEFKQAWEKNIGKDECQEVISFAKERLSDASGKVSRQDLEVALHKFYPAEYKKAISMSEAEKVRQRIVNAETKKQPRISGAGSSQTPVNTISIKKLYAMDEDELANFLAPLSMDTVKKIELAMKKYKK